MLICPQCQLENPNSNKFCQGCGISLTNQVCLTCGTDVSLSISKCPNCGAEIGTVWSAIISGRNLPLGSVEAGNLPAGAYLDQQHRYQLLEPLVLPPTITAQTELQVKVLDCQPFQLSLLQANADLLIEIKIPVIARTYIALQTEFGDQIPTIHDAWQQEGQQVILIADRLDWDELSQLWQSEQVTLLQILQWFDEMVELWAALEPWQCRQSLLELSNLRVDCQQKLGLQRLYTELETEQPLSLQDLGQVWQRLFQVSQRTKFGSLVELLSDLQSGDILTPTQLRSRLQAIVSEIQANIDYTCEPRLNESTALKSDADATKTKEAVTLNKTAKSTVLKMSELHNSQMSKSDDMPTLVLPMQLVSLEDAGSTDVGSQRHHNEDYFSTETTINKLEFPKSRTFQAQGIYILCDGMGGHAGGEVASMLAVETLKQYFQTHWQPNSSLPTEDTLREAVRLANQAIYDLNQQDARSGIGRMGTTLVLVLLHNTQVAVAHVGDSRLYRLSRKRGLEQVTLDHEVGQREILRGVEPEIAYARPDAYQLTQALGPRDENFIYPDVQFLELNEDTLLLMVSDGLSDNGLLERPSDTISSSVSSFSSRHCCLWCLMVFLITVY